MIKMNGLLETDGADTIGMIRLGLIVIGIAIYFLPAIIAAKRAHHQAAAIFLLDLFLGWSFIGWVAALVWSATAKRQVIVQPSAGSVEIERGGLLPFNLDKE